MKTTSLILAFSIFSQNAFATALPSYLAEKLDQANSDSSLQMIANNSIARVASAKNYIDETKRQVNRDLGGWEHVLNASAYSGLGSTTAGMLTAFFSHPLNDSNASASVGVREGSYIGLAAALFVGGAAISGGALALSTKEQREYYLNDSRADHFAAAVAKSMAHFFQLSKQKEDSIKFAIKEELHKRAKAKNYADVDVMALVKEAKQGERSVLSDAQKLQLDLIRQKMVELNEAKRNKEPGPKFSEDDKIRLLSAQKAILRTHLNLMSPNEQATTSIGGQIAANDRLLAEIKQFKLSQGDKVEEGDKSEGNAPAE